MPRLTSRLAVALGIIVACAPTLTSTGAEPRISIGIFEGDRPTSATVDASSVAPYDVRALYQIYSSSLIVRALPSSKPEDDIAALIKAFGLRDATLINETKLSEPPAVVACEVKARSSVSKSFDVEMGGLVFGFVIVTSDSAMAPGNVRIKIFEHDKIARVEESGTGAEGVIPSSYTVDAVISLSAAPTTALGFLDSTGTPRLVVFRRGV